ncbi:MAG: hypothetical protein EA383_11135 [Spirochaetaceae bacterium]|nr:MAG: hypothetical protein EA383_11135 [Spirochaetaceae bacterium]
MEQRTHRTSQTSRTTLAAAGLVTLAVLLIPAVAWTRDAAQFYGTDMGGAFLGVYLPARLMALMGLTLMFFQFILSARLPFIESRFKRSSLLKTHRTAGKAAYLLVLLHGTGMLTFDLISSGEIFLYLENTVGLIALVLLTLAVLAAWFFKPLKLSRKHWRVIHFLTYLVFPMVVWHALALGSTVNSVRSLQILLHVFLGGYVLILGYRLYGVVRSRAVPSK